MLRRVLGWLALLLGVAAFVSIYVTPWPSVLVIRALFDSGAEAASKALSSRVPSDIIVRGGLSYDPNDKDALFDIYQPSNQRVGNPVIVWIHGGGFVSGQRSDVENYGKILAGRGFTVINLDYTIAPEASYPTPIRQVNAALGFLAAHAKRLGISADRIVLAGDSAGAQIAAQTAAIITNPVYAKTVGIDPAIDADRLAGALLYCGVFDITDLGKGGGLGGWFIKVTSWAYSGERNWRDAKGFETMSVAPNVTDSFPPTFISAGNIDPLAPQSVAMAEAIKAKGVPVTSVFYPVNHKPGLDHEYQFNLNLQDSQKVLDRSVEWLKAL